MLRFVQHRMVSDDGVWTVEGIGLDRGHGPKRSCG